MLSSPFSTMPHYNLKDGLIPIVVRPTHFSVRLQNLSLVVVISTFLAAAAFAYAGILLLTSGGSEGKKDEAKKIFTKVLIGYLWILGAWVIVYTIVNVLLEPSYLLLTPP